MQVIDPERMRKHRIAADLTQAQTAKRADMPQSRWSDIESGSRTNVTIETAGRIAYAIGCEVKDLLAPPKNGR